MIQERVRKVNSGKVNSKKNQTVQLTFNHRIFSDLLMMRRQLPTCFNVVIIITAIKLCFGTICIVGFLINRFFVLKALTVFVMCAISSFVTGMILLIGVGFRMCLRRWISFCLLGASECNENMHISKKRIELEL